MRGVRRHNEIDKLLGGLKSELELWRAEFESLQAFWFSHVVEPGQGEPAQFATLLDFQRALARHIEDVDLDLQQLEERLAAVDADREELVELLQDGRREVDRLEQEGARLRREAAAGKKAGERAAAQAQQQVNLLSEVGGRLPTGGREEPPPPQHPQGLTTAAVMRPSPTAAASWRRPRQSWTSWRRARRGWSSRRPT